MEKWNFKISKKFQKIEEILFFIRNEGITVIPEVEPILLDLENLFLLSVSLENWNFQETTEKKTKLEQNLAVKI